MTCQFVNLLSACSNEKDVFLIWKGKFVNFFLTAALSYIIDKIEKAQLKMKNIEKSTIKNDEYSKNHN